jgi:MarR family transcriptional regulator, 2-MHQ and catechol-resistance regulon repressor
MKEHLPEQAKQLHQALTHLVQKYQFRDRNDICCYGISVSQCHTLEALGQHGTQTMQALAAHLHLAVSTVTRVVDQLVDKGLVERHTGATDRRVCEVALTPSGTDLLYTLQGELIARELAVLERIPPASRAHVIWAIEALSAAVDEWRKSVPQDAETRRQSCS